MIDYLLEIEKRLGRWNKLPNNPFFIDFHYAVFPSLDDDLIFKSLYKALFKANKEIGNEHFIVKSVLDIKGKEPTALVQSQLLWDEFETFQGIDLSYEGFYITGNNFDWLGIYHPDDYVVIGGDDSFINNICRDVYGELSWKCEFKKAYTEGRLNMYGSDFKAIEESLIKCQARK